MCRKLQRTLTGQGDRSALAVGHVTLVTPFYGCNYRSITTYLTQSCYCQNVLHQKME
jgi:hypothetical protein